MAETTTEEEKEKKTKKKLQFKIRESEHFPPALIQAIDSMGITGLTRNIINASLNIRVPEDATTIEDLEKYLHELQPRHFYSTFSNVEWLGVSNQVPSSLRRENRPLSFSIPLKAKAKMQGVVEVEAQTEIPIDWSPEALRTIGLTREDFKPRLKDHLRSAVRRRVNALSVSDMTSGVQGDVSDLAFVNGSAPELVNWSDEELVQLANTLMDSYEQAMGQRYPGRPASESTI